jgi:hypothetical protein
MGHCLSGEYKTSPAKVSNGAWLQAVPPTKGQGTNTHRSLHACSLHRPVFMLTDFQPQVHCNTISLKARSGPENSLTSSQEPPLAERVEPRQLSNAATSPDGVQELMLDSGGRFPPVFKPSPAVKWPRRAAGARYKAGGTPCVRASKARTCESAVVALTP